MNEIVCFYEAFAVISVCDTYLMDRVNDRFAIDLLLDELGIRWFMYVYMY